MTEDKIFDIVVKNNENYGKQLQYYQSYAYTEIPKKSAKTLKGANENAIAFYRSCGFEVDVKTRKMEVLNEVPEILPEEKKDLTNLNEVGVKKLSGESTIEEPKEIINETLETKLKKLDLEKIRALLSSIGVNPRNIMDKEKLINLALEEDENLLLDILTFKR